MSRPAGADSAVLHEPKAAAAVLPDAGAAAEEVAAMAKARRASEMVLIPPVDQPLPVG